MIIIHGSRPRSCLKAAMLARLYKGLCIYKGEYANTLFFGEETHDSDSLCLGDVIRQYEAVFGIQDWMKSKKAADLSRAVYYASRYNSSDRYRLIITVLLQALEYGPEYVLSRVSGDARTMFNRARKVCMEIHRAYGFIRLTPFENKGDKFMVGKTDFEHDICDIVLRYFTRRHKSRQIYLLAGDQACYLEDGLAKATDVADLPFTLPADDFNRLWEAYYDSQFIEGRKNPALARKHLPKKYWSWVPEGNKLR